MMNLALIGLESAINAACNLDPDTQQALAKLKGHVVKIIIRDWLIEFYLLPQTHGVQLVKHTHLPVDTTISGNLFSLLKISQSKGSSQSLFENQIDISGDTDLGVKIRDILRHIDIDWEEHLSKFVGDGVAHKAMFHLKRLLRIGQRSADTLTDNVKDYLHDESACFPSTQEAENFYAEIGTTRDDVDRLEARVNQLLATR